MKKGNIAREILHNFWTTWVISMKFSGKMCLTRILSHKKPRFHPLFRRYIFRKIFDLPNRFGVNKYLLILVTLNNFCKKNLCKDLLFLWRFQCSCKVVHVQKILLSEHFQKKDGGSFKILTSSSFLGQLWTTFARKLMTRPTAFMTYFQSSCQVVHIHKVLLFAIFC